MGDTYLFIYSYKDTSDDPKLHFGRKIVDGISEITYDVLDDIEYHLSIQRWDVQDISIINVIKL